MEGVSASSSRPKVMVTNDDGIDAPGLRALVQALVAAGRYDVLVCAPHTERSAASHSIVWHQITYANRVEIEGATAYAVSGTPADCTSLGISKKLFSGQVPDLKLKKWNEAWGHFLQKMWKDLVPPKTAHLWAYATGLARIELDNKFLVLSGINMGSNAGYHIVYSGTVAGAREAFLYGVPSVALSYDWVSGKSSVNDFKLAAEACLPMIDSIIRDIMNKTYPGGAFLNIDLPTDIASNKGFKLTKQGKHMIRVGWKQIIPSNPGGKSSSTMDMEVNSITGPEKSSAASSPEQLMFKREVVAELEREADPDLDYVALREGYISVTPLGALSAAENDAHSCFKDWMFCLAELSASAL